MLGHSWGGTLALLSILDRPQLVDGVIDVAGPVDVLANLRESYRMTLDWATEQKNAEAIKELESAGPPPYNDFNQQLVLAKWSSAALGGIDKNISMDKLLSRAPYTKFDDSWGNAELGVVKAMYAELSRVNMEPQLPQLKTPLLVIVGKRDSVVPASSMRPGFELYGGPKEWVELSDSHHLQFVDEPEAFAKAIEGFVH
ncbi:MAG TPA: alpha/beta hydrolase [Blastocatellia bacterium]|nr:alpha/beta hydrolase [Blastocatellia bacterium]